MDRAEALARLAALGVNNDLNSKEEAPTVAATGQEVYAGGDEARVLVKEAHLTYREGGDLLHAFAAVGDTVTLTKTQAKRLDGLGVTVTPETFEDAGAPAEGKLTDEQLAAMNAPDVIAHVNQHPEDKARVRALEEQRDQPRVTVLKAAEVDDEGDGEEFDPEDEV